MTTTPSPLPDHTVPPASPNAADELLVHGLLEYLHERDDAKKSARIASVMRAIEETQRPRRLLFASVARWGLAVAAALAIGTVLTLYGLPIESSALAEVRQSIDAARAPGDRRYDIRVLASPKDDPARAPGAVIDMRAPKLLVVRHRPPGAEQDIVVGKDDQGPWAIREDGAVTRDDTRFYWPPWSLDDQTLLVTSIDELLEQLPDQYSLQRKPAQSLPGTATPLLDRVRAERLDRRGPKPHFIELWINPETHLPERLEMRWDPNDRGGPPVGPHGREPGAGPRPGDRMMVLRRVDSPSLPQGWFTPNHHAR